MERRNFSGEFLLKLTLPLYQQGRVSPEARGAASAYTTPAAARRRAAQGYQKRYPGVGELEDGPRAVEAFGTEVQAAQVALDTAS